MAGTNGHLEERIGKTETDTAELRQLVLSEFRAMRAEFATAQTELKQGLRAIQVAVDVIIQYMALDERKDGNA